MAFRTLGIIILLFSTASFAQGRGPAVEDFVGIEVEEAPAALPGTESLFNLEQDLTRYEEKKSKQPLQKKDVPPANYNSDIQPSTIFGITIVLGLPLMIWFLMMSHLKKKASLESASNIAVLENYRKERERKSEKNVRKAS